MKLFLLFVLLFQQPGNLIVEYDEFNDFTLVKTSKLLVLDAEAEKMQFTFWTTCKGKQSKDCGDAPFASIGLLSKHDNLAFSKTVLAIADGERLDLGEAVLIKTEPEDGWQFHSLMMTFKPDQFQKIARAKVLKMQIGGVLAFSFSAAQLKEMKEMADKFPR